jgi:transcriptional regulator with XRE-family HTH domain
VVDSRREIELEELGMPVKTINTSIGQAYYKRSDLLKRVGEMLRQKRKQVLKLTLQQVARKLGIHHTTVSRWENGWNSPIDPDIVGGISNVYRLNSEETALLSEASFVNPKLLNSYQENMSAGIANLDNNVEFITPVAIQNSGEARGSAPATPRRPTGLPVTPVKYTVWQESYSRPHIDYKLYTEESPELPDMKLLLHENGVAIQGGGPTEALVDAFADHAVNLISVFKYHTLRALKLTFATGVQLVAYYKPLTLVNTICLECARNPDYFRTDEELWVYEKVADESNMVFPSPVYFWALKQWSSLLGTPDILRELAPDTTDEWVIDYG